MSFLSDDCIIGTFTHRLDYLPRLQESAYRCFPHVPFVAVIRQDKINRNMEALRQVFLRSGRRYWVFLDDDIVFLSPDTLEVALRTMIRHQLGICGVYSSFNPEVLERPYDVSRLREEIVGWVPGYFMMVDSWKIGHIQPVQDLPDGNTAVDTTYCMLARMEGYPIGVAPALVYHQKKQVWVDQEAWSKTVEYLNRRWPLYSSLITYIEVVVEW